MQLLICYETHDRTAFRAAHGETRERRDQAGLTQLQLWEEAEAPNRLWALYGVSDRDKAEAWLAEKSSLSSQLSGLDSHFLATA
ncbi:hypothetical protein [Palleronia abyssalis]|uniref:Uncharacterized protein n=1 Tax=Palleronia abyssalis TaxID=1501240 RepID=A0A2R8C1T6_9RHOB|nr:hypothetical protein [Palleronia abyssalis]SPJ26286.1 hypothetical protein PAA8504_04143 [Palleronia abyssalis]